MVKLFFEHVNHNQVIVKTGEGNERPIDAVSCEVWVHVFIDLNIFTGEFFVLVLLVDIFYLVIFFLFKDGLVENEFIISHAVHSDCLYQKPFLLFRGSMAVTMSAMSMTFGSLSFFNAASLDLDFHVMNFDEARLDVSIELH